MSDPVDERDFLLRSLEDLEREHDAGDLDDDDYLVLRDDYTARAAAALRAPSATPRVPRRPKRGLLVVAAVLAFAGIAGVVVAQASGRRDAGDTASGSVDQSITEKLNEARRCFSEGDADCAIELYEEVLAEQPTNAEALTYKGWAQFTLLGDTDAALTTLIEAATAHEDYPDVHAFLAVLFFRNRLYQQASNELDRLDALDPPPDLLAQIEGLATSTGRAPPWPPPPPPVDGSGRRWDVAALGEVLALPGEDPDRRLLPAQLVLELRAVGHEVLEQIGDDVAVAAQHRVTSTHLGRHRQGAGGSGALRQALVRLDRQAQGLAERLEGLHAAGERARHQAGDVAVLEGGGDPLRLAPPALAELPSLVRLRPVAPVPRVGVSHDVELGHGR